MLSAIADLPNWRRQGIRERVRPRMFSGLRQPQKLSQVFLNPLIKAAQAIEKGGTIRLRSEQVGKRIEISIYYNGCGIAKENLDKIFEPFFTTKEVGVVTGLGLAILQDIVSQHQGEIRVKSQLNEGTTFSVCLPII